MELDGTPIVGGVVGAVTESLENLNTCPYYLFRLSRHGYHYSSDDISGGINACPHNYTILL